MSTMIHPYLFFAGRCDEAIAFYQKALGAEVKMMMRHNQCPQPAPPGMLQAGFENKVMHADISVQGAALMMSDGCDDKGKFDGFRLSITYDTEADAHKAFNALAEGGSVMMPLSKTFWSPCFGMLTDKFGVGWMLGLPGEPPKRSVRGTVPSGGWYRQWLDGDSQYLQPRYLYWRSPHESHGHR